MRVEHPAYVLGIGRPGSVPLPPAYDRLQADVDEDGYFEVDDEDAGAVMSRLAERYEIEYDGSDVVVPEDHPSRDGESADEQPGGSDDAADGADGDEDGDGDAGYSRDALEGMDHDKRKEIYRDLGGDTDEIDMRKSGEVIAGILRLQAANGGE